MKVIYSIAILSLMSLFTTSLWAQKNSIFGKRPTPRINSTLTDAATEPIKLPTEAPSTSSPDPSAGPAAESTIVDKPFNTFIEKAPTTKVIRPTPKGSFGGASPIVTKGPINTIQIFRGETLKGTALTNTCRSQATKLKANDFATAEAFANYESRCESLNNTTSSFGKSGVIQIKNSLNPQDDKNSKTKIGLFNRTIATQDDKNPTTRTAIFNRTIATKESSKLERTIATGPKITASNPKFNAPVEANNRTIFKGDSLSIGRVIKTDDDATTIKPARIANVS